MKNRRIVIVTSVLMVLLGSTTATAVPIEWTMSSPSDFFPSGEFTFDADTDVFSDVFVEGVGGDNYFDFLGDALGFQGEGIFFGDILAVTLDAAMTNAGGMITGSYTEIFPSGTLEGTVELFAIGVGVPEPPVLALVGLGLVVLSLKRRTKSPSGKPGEV